MHLNTKADKSNTYDAIVVGSGISGGWAAKELCEQGLKVLLLERGRNFEHVKDYETAMKAPWELPHRNKLTNEIREKFPQQTIESSYPIDEANQALWQADAEVDYHNTDKFSWFRASVVGGRSLLWGRQCYRWSDLDFEANAKDGIGNDWAIRYKDLEKWYDYVENFAGISGNYDNIAHLPNSKFQPAMEMNCLEKSIKEKFKAIYGNDRHFIMGRVAHITSPQAIHTELGRASCQYRNLCSRGCPYGGYFSTQAATLPAAMKTGNLTLRPDSVVSRVIYDDAKGKTTGVEVIDTTSKKTTEFYTKIIILNASTIATAQIMLNSTSKRFPNGLGNDSDMLGRNVMDHVSRIGASGMAEGMEEDYYYGRRANGIFIPRFRNIGKDKQNYLRGFNYQGGASRQGWERGIGSEGFGADFKDNLSNAGAWTFSLGGYGECLPYKENRMYLHESEKDMFGLPKVAFDCELKENELQIRKAIGDDAAEMLEAIGLKNVKINDRPYILGLSKHEMGTACMGNDPKTSVLNKYNQVWGAENVFVTDGACMASSSAVNPSLTYMALTARACHYAVEELKKQNL